MVVIGEEYFVHLIITFLGKYFEISSDEELHTFMSPEISWDVYIWKIFFFKGDHIRDCVSCFLLDFYIWVKTTTDLSFKDLSPQPKHETASSGHFPSRLVPSYGCFSVQVQMFLFLSTNFTNSSVIPLRHAGKPEDSVRIPPNSTNHVTLSAWLRQ